MPTVSRTRGTWLGKIPPSILTGPANLMRPQSLLPIISVQGNKNHRCSQSHWEPITVPCRCPHPCHCVGNILPCAHSHCAQDRYTGGVHPCARTRSETLHRGGQVVGLPSLVWGSRSSHGVFKEERKDTRLVSNRYTTSRCWCVWPREITPHIASNCSSALQRSHLSEVG